MKHLGALRLITGLAVFLAAGPAFANRQITGYSGKGGQICSACHSGGAAPSSVAFQGPATLAAGQTAEYTLAVTGNNVAANIATEDSPESSVLTEAAAAMPRMSGIKLTPVANVVAGFTELVHDQQRNNPSLRFSVTAPKYAGSVRLWAAAMSTNGNGTGGDGARAATFTINVTGPAYTPPGSSTSSSSGASTSSSGASTSSSSGGTSTSSSGGTSTSSSGGSTSSGGSSGSSGEDLGDDGSDDEGGRGGLGSESGGCAVSEGRGLFGSGGGAAGAAALGLVVGSALVRRRRRA